MAGERKKDDFDELKGHVKDAVRSTLLAVRGAVDAAIDLLDGERDRPRDAARPDGEATQERTGQNGA